ncbi:MAG: hypothetical protein Fur0032_05730 [Terrimicrobiaceae bacterium]
MVPAGKRLTLPSGRRPPSSPTSNICSALVRAADPPPISKVQKPHLDITILCDGVLAGIVQPAIQCLECLTDARSGCHTGNGDAPKADQNADDGHHHQQFHQGKSLYSVDHLDEAMGMLLSKRR